VKPAALWFALAAFAATLGPGLAQEPNSGASPTAEELVARSKLAEDAAHRPEAERETWEFHAATLDGTLELVRRGDDSVTESSLGPFHTERGVWHGEHWHQNENGETVLERPEPSQSERPVTQTVERVREPVDAWALTTTYASGHVTRIFYDPRTYYVVRSEKTVAGRTIHTNYDDFRTDARGRTRFWHYYGGDDRPDNDFDYRLTSDDETTDVAEADVAIPRDRRTLVEFPAGVDTVRLPARIENDRIYVRLNVAGRGLDFLLDTGASAITINETVARELKLPIYGRSTQTIAGSFVTARVVAPEIAIGPLVMHDVVLRTVPLASNESRDTRIVGLLGFDFLDAVGLKIDYENGTVDALRPGSLVPPANATPLDVRLNSGWPVVHATVGEASGDDFILDTGAAVTYVVFQRFTRAHPEAFGDETDTPVLSASGVGGSIPYRTVTAKRIGIGPLNFDDERGGDEAVSANALGFDNQDGLIGGDILKLFTVYLDYGASRVYLEPNGREPMLEAGGDAQPSAGLRESSRATPAPRETDLEHGDHGSARPSSHGRR
jgi:predicted aspartyl protease